MRSIFLKRGCPIWSSTASTPTSTGIAARKTAARFGAIAKAITVAITSIMGDRMSTRRKCCIVLRTVLTSVVVLVIRLGVENLSAFENEKLWIFPRSEERRFLAKPWLATAEKRALKSPQVIERQAVSTIIAPTVITKRSLFATSSAGKSQLSIKFSSR